MRKEMQRLPLVDALKAFACLTIVIHHLCFYGPLTDELRPFFPESINFFDVYGRMAVQVFLVVSGFLFGAKFLNGSGTGTGSSGPLQILRQRYIRLVTPYSAALLLAIVCSALARLGMDHHSISDTPTPLQIVAHIFLLHDLLGYEALSAGVWYVAIDFQLFALAVLLLWLPGRLGARQGLLQHGGVALVGLMTVVSLFYFNRQDMLDVTALYFFGSFGLGILGWWATTRQNAHDWLLVLAGLTIAALVVQFRPRLAIALVVMLVLGLGRLEGFLHTLPIPTAIGRLSKISYSVFLVHFPLCLVMNAIGINLFEGNPVLQGVWVLASVALSVAVGQVFHERVESYPFPTKLKLLLPAGAVVAGWLAAVVSGFVG
ncbi:acyltransferase family protein [Zoogloea sp.]|uniref:acyltransferase family protein n=1 Tax=Zoogloea sp. TaxID=49181 RepID=UPI0035AE51C9